MKRILLALTLAVASTLAMAADKVNEGAKADYVAYCASCHAVDGMGNGPLADTLKVRPTDLTVIGKKNGRSDAEMAAFQKAYAEDMALAVEQDFPIWENKVYHSAPRLCDGDGPVPDFRRWAAQFYVAEDVR